MGLDVVAVGYGGIARPQLRYLDELADVTVVGGADIDRDARAQFEADFDAPSYATHQELLAEHGNADAATIITPHAIHREQILACVETGLDVYVEKPLVVGLDAAVEVIRAARLRDHILQVGYQRHFHPLFERLREVVTSGRIGEPHFAACHLEQNWIDPQRGTWRTDPAISGGGQLYDSGSHLLDALLWCTDAEPHRVAAIMDAEDGVDVNSALAVELHRDGRQVTASVGVTADGPTYPVTDEALVIVGTAGKVTYGDETVTIVERGDEPGETRTRRISESVDESDVFVAKLDDFVAAARSEREPAVPGEMALGVTALTEAAYEAHDTGTVVDVGERLSRARSAIDATTDTGA